MRKAGCSKPERTAVTYARMLLMLHEGASSREKIAEELGISLSKTTRCFVILRSLARMRIEFSPLAVMDERTGRRTRGRTGVMRIADWGILPEHQTLMVCRQLVREADKAAAPSE